MLGAAVFGIIINIPENLGVGIPLIQEKGQRDPKWKLIGGKMKQHEFPAITVCREINEEVSINISRPEDKDIVFFVPKKEHNFIAYECSYYNGIFCPGNEIEVIGTFEKDEILAMIRRGEVLKNHADALLEYFRTR